MVEVAQVGVTTRARNLAMTEGGEKGKDNGGAKRRKMSAEEIYSSSSLVDQLSNRRKVPENEVYQANSGQNESGPSQCSSNGTVAVANAGGGSVTRSLAEIVEIESSVSSHQRKRERTPSSLTEEDPQMEDLEEANMERQSAVRNSKRRSTKNIVQVPLHAELEDFFSAIEEESQKRFVDKYNFDIVKEVPMEGRYGWVELKP